MYFRFEKYSIRANSYQDCNSSDNTDMVVRTANNVQLDVTASSDAGPVYSSIDVYYMKWYRDNQISILRDLYTELDQVIADAYAAEGNSEDEDDDDNGEDSSNEEV